MQLRTVTLLQDMNQAARPAFFEKDEQKKKELYDKGHGVLLTNSQYLTPHLFSAAPASSFGDSGGAERGCTSNLLLFTLAPAQGHAEGWGARRLSHLLLAPLLFQLLKSLALHLILRIPSLVEWWI